MMLARDLTHRLGGRWFRSYGTAPCPVCQPERRADQNALTLHEGIAGKLLLHCKKSECAFVDILSAAGVEHEAYRAPDVRKTAGREAKCKAYDAERSRQAERCWQETLPMYGTPAETYLRGRAITCDLPSSLRFHPAAWHGPSESRHPCMVALVEGVDGFAVHRTYLEPDGSGKAAVNPSKMMLGKTSGGAVRLTEAPGGLVIAEGIETALSLACGLLPGAATIWAALSTSGIRSLTLPRRAGRLTIAPDGDAVGGSAARELANRAYALGWPVELLIPPEGHDWNDILKKEECHERG